MLDEAPRLGVCTSCGGIKGIDFQRTNLHHLAYDDNDPLKDTVELCVGCHTKEHYRLNPQRRGMLNMRRASLAASRAS